MNWKSTADFLAMGGYGAYVWGAYAATALLMGIEPWLASRRRRRAMRSAAAASAREPRA